MKTINKTMTNAEIYEMALLFNKVKFDEDIYFPAAINFSIQKNKKNILEIAEGIEENRANIIKHYGNIKEDGSFIIPEDKITIANQELNDLLKITQEIKLFIFNIEDIKDIKLSSQQMEILMIMIDDEE